MTTNDVAPLPLSARVRQLFVTFHSRTEPEQSLEHVARAISTMLGRVVAAGEVEALREGEHDDHAADAEILEAIATHFQVPAAYLNLNGDQATAAVIDRELRLLAAARDAGVRHLALRGEEVDIDKLAGELSLLADENPHVSDELDFDGSEHDQQRTAE